MSCNPATPVASPLRARPTPALLVLLVAAATWGQQSALAPPAPTPAIGERLQVTSVDLWVSVDRGPLAVSSKLEPGGLELRLAGEPAEIAAVEKGAIGRESRRLVVFIDTALGDQASVRWSASRLAERAGDLVAIGDVEVVVADPDPRVVLAATADAERLKGALYNLALFAGTDAAIPLLRDEFSNLTEDDADLELARSFLEEEIALVLQRQDLLLRWLIDQTPTPGADRSSRRSGGVLLYVNQGFDLEPGGFYLDTSGPEGSLQQETATWVRTLAAYGWTCAPLVFEDRRALLRRGLRIGKWRFGIPRGTTSMTGGPLVLLGASYEGERDAGKAAALVELGDTHLAAGDFEPASDAYLRAIHHFYGDPRTRPRQAYAWRQLALALKGSGRADPSRRALANAIELDPTLALETEHQTAEWTIGVGGLEQMASETGGWLLRGGGDLLTAVEEISRRQRLSFTLQGTASGDLLPIELTAKGRAGRLRYARWTRSGAPERIATARLRLFLENAVSEPGVEGSASLHRIALSSGRSPVVLSLPALDSSRPHRVLVGTIGEESPPHVVALAFDANQSAPGQWLGVLEATGDAIAAAMYTEDLSSGEWDITLVSVVSE